MSELTLTKTRLIAGVWEGELTGLVGDVAPALHVSHLNDTLEGLEIKRDGDRWFVRVPVPADRLADGIQTFVIAQTDTGETLASFALLAGDALSEDIRAEVDLLRAELDMLKQAFRRHCLETAADV